MTDGWTTWRVSVRVELARCKRAGMTFDAAWNVALVAHPPRQMELGPRVPQLDDEESVVEFFRRSCADAWHGRRGELEDLPSALEGGLARNWPTVGRGVLGR